MKTLADIARESGLNISTLKWLSRSTAHYIRTEKPKPQGGTRVIYSPDIPMRHAQGYIANVLLLGTVAHPSANAYVSGKNAKSALQPHTAFKGSFIRLDLKDFFPSITDVMVDRVIRQAADIDSEASRVLAGICTLEGRLPQGAITSPKLSNMVFYTIDDKLWRLAQTWQGCYTRYADDLLFSLGMAVGDNTAQRFINSVARILGTNGFKLNPTKTHIMTPPTRKNALSLAVAENVRLYRTARKQFDALCEANTIAVEGGARSMESADTFYLCGMLAYMQMVNPQDAERMVKKYTWLQKRAV
jgi:hypothetical protein